MSGPRASAAPTVTRIDAIPLVDDLGPAGAYGSSRGLVPARRVTLVRLETSDGVVGWGEAWGGSAANPVLVREAAEVLLGAPLEPSGPWLSRLLQQGYHHTTGGPHVAAVSALDLAMWDAFGRTLGVPVHRLLGGRARDSLTAYASAGYVTPDNDPAAYEEGLRRVVAEGFTGLKIKLGLGVDVDVARTAAAREALGPERALFVDFNGNYTADQALRAIEALRPFRPAWVEEPVPPDDHDGLRLLRSAGVPIAGGEAVYTRYNFRPLIAGRLLDVVQPDVSKCGGLGEDRVIGHLAQTWNVRFSPHVWGGVVAQAASLHLLASIPNYPHTDHVPEPLWLEFDRGRNALRDELAVCPAVARDGQVEVPDGPGFGIEIDEAAVERLRSDR